jgi:hypothetical protein
MLNLFFNVYSCFYTHKAQFPQRFLIGIRHCTFALVGIIKPLGEASPEYLRGIYSNTAKHKILEARA